MGGLATPANPSTKVKVLNFAATAAPSHFCLHQPALPAASEFSEIFGAFAHWSIDTYTLKGYKWVDKWTESYIESWSS